MARSGFVLFLGAIGMIASGCGGDCADDKKIDSWMDGDGDGFGSGDVVAVCEFDATHVDNNDDCDDENADLNPDAEEACNGLDDDCNDVIDNGLDLVLFFRDNDLDGYGNGDQVQLMCDRPPGDDAWAPNGDDCDDADNTRNPGATEICNDGIDDDCDELADDADTSVDPDSFTAWYQDTDGDGYGRDGASTTACIGPAGSAPNPDDCDDQKAEVNPDAQEVCGGGDNDCDDLVDDLDDSLDPAGQMEYFADVDQDGFGEPGSSVMACAPIPQFSASDNEGDCDDANEYANPSLPEDRCDSADNDCDVETPDDTDLDLDGFMFCGGDCNDNQALINPDAEELPGDGVDMDCDAMELCYQDVDADGARTTTSVLGADLTCSIAPNANASRPVDCDDNDAAITISGDWELDSDGDGFSDGTTAIHQCTDPGAGYLLAEDGPTDCDDTANTTFPGADVDECNDGVDADCNTLDSCSTCQEWLSTDAGLASGVYALRPTGGMNEQDVYCDMDEDGGGWTLVGSSLTPFNDAGVGYFADVATLTPAGNNPAVFNGLGLLITATSDVRFACKLDPADATFTVDLSFYDVDWYLEMAQAATDGDSCFSDAAAPDATPARRNNLTNVFKATTDAYNSGSLIGEDACNAGQDFTVDFDDAGMNSDESDGTDWGEDDNIAKCGDAGVGGAFFMFVRETE
ncbi:MAG: MopE-related protein [Myxococcota bacterium]